MYLFISYMDIPNEYKDVLLEAGIRNTKALHQMSEKEIREAGKAIHKEVAVFVAAKYVLKKVKEIRKEKHAAKRRGVQQPVDIKTEKLGCLLLSLHSQTCLEKAGIITVGDLIKLTDKELHKIHTLGKRAEKEIKEKLKNKELSLSQTSQHWDDLEDFGYDMSDDDDEDMFDILDEFINQNSDNSWVNCFNRGTVQLGEKRLSTFRECWKRQLGQMWDTAFAEACDNREIIAEAPNKSNVKQHVQCNALVKTGTSW